MLKVTWITLYDFLFTNTKLELKVSTLQQKQIKTVERDIANVEEEMKRYGPEIETIERSMQEREQRIEEIKLKMNTVEDDVFSDFCNEIGETIFKKKIGLLRKDFVGVKNIRQYEDRELRAQEERKQKRFEFQKQVNRITSNLEFEKSRDTLSNVSRWERAVNDEEEKLETAKKQEAKQRDDIDKDLKLLDELKAQKMSKKKEVEEMEEELGKLTQSFKFDIIFTYKLTTFISGKARREVGSINKDLQAIQKSVVSIESKIESLKGDRHAILMHCKVIL